MLILLWVFLSLFMVFSIDILSFSLKRRGWLRFSSTFFIFISQVIITEFVLGSISRLNGTNVLILNIAISSLLLFICMKIYGANTLYKYFTNLKKSASNIINLLKSDPFWATLLILAILLLAWVIFLGILFPATDFDGNSYHLTFIGNVMQNGNFFDSPSSLKWLIGYPKGGEFIQLWSVIISRTDILTDLTQIPFLILGIYALYEMSSTLGAEKKHARFSSLLFLFIPIVINQLKTTYVDVMLCSLFFAAISMLIKKKLTILDLLLVGIIFSLIISVKSTGLLFVIVLIPLLFWNLNNHRNTKTLDIFNNFIKPLLIITIPTLFGAYWYIKNYISYNSPIYPFGFKLLGYSIFPGKTFQEFAANAIDSVTTLPKGYFARIWYVWTEQKDWYGCMYNYDTNYAGLGPVWFILFIPSIIISAYITFKKRNLINFIVTGTILTLFIIYPSNYYSRYTLFILAIGIYSFSIILSNINKITRNIIKGLSIVLVFYVIFTTFTLCNYSPLVIKDQIKSLRYGSIRGEIYNNNPGSAYVFLENKILSGETVAYDSKPFFIYPLWKPDYSNKVIFVTSNNATGWYQALDRNNVDYIFTTLNSQENKWAKSKFKSIYKDELYEIFKKN